MKKITFLLLSLFLIISCNQKQEKKINNTSFSSEEKNLLDVGCGTGDFLQTAFKNNWKV